MMLRGMWDLRQQEGMFVEPSCAAALAGPWHLSRWGSLKMPSSGSPAGAGGPEPGSYARGLMEGGTHVVWATGGAMVPDDERRVMLELGRLQEGGMSPLGG
jgi:D-serine dehydratase